MKSLKEKNNNAADSYAWSLWVASGFLVMMSMLFRRVEAERETPATTNRNLLEEPKDLAMARLPFSIFYLTPLNSH